MSDTDVVDISSDLPGESYDLHMVRPGTSTPNGWIITLCGPAHEKAVRYQEKIKRESLHRESRQEAAQVNGRKYKPDELTPEESDRQRLEWIASRILTWTPVKIGPTTYAFSDDVVIELFRRPEMANFLQQVVDYLRSERAFIPGSAKP